MKAKICLVCNKPLEGRKIKYCGNAKSKFSWAWKAERKHHVVTPERRIKLNELARINSSRKARRLKLRFSIFTRDKLTCQYCGRKAPQVVLQIDHKYPESKGGLSSLDNLITACLECNVGKQDVILTEFNH